MKVAVGSTNPIKIKAVKLAFKKVWPKEKWHVVGIKVKTSVPDQPMSDQEAIKGAKARARKAMVALQADFAVGLEGGLQQIGQDWFDCGWAVVMDKNGKVGIGSSVRCHAPDSMMKLVKKGMELGLVNDKIFARVNSKKAEGHFGLMTNNAITRTQGYKDGVIMALSRFIHPELFKK